MSGIVPTTERFRRFNPVMCKLRRPGLYTKAVYKDAKIFPEKLFCWP